jgi:hypothetical protein
VRVRLVRKRADQLNGVDVSDRDVGDVIDLPRAQAELLLAEKWADPATDHPQILGGARRLTSPPRRSRKPTD